MPDNIPKVKVIVTKLDGEVLEAIVVSPTERQVNITDERKMAQSVVNVIEDRFETEDPT